VIVLKIVFGKYVDIKERREINLPPLLDSERTNFIVRLAGRRPAGRHRRLVGPHRLVFHARAVGARAPVFRDLAAGPLAVRDRPIFPVRLDFVVCS
jgi:hypothetical protein